MVSQVASATSKAQSVNNATAKPDIVVVGTTSLASTATDVLPVQLE
jgi:hypothetical protein